MIPYKLLYEIVVLPIIRPSTIVTYLQNKAMVYLIDIVSFLGEGGWLGGWGGRGGVGKSATTIFPFPLFFN